MVDISIREYMDNNGRITSVDLMEIINLFREAEKLSKINHDDVIKHIEEEIEALECCELDYDNLFLKKEDGSYLITKNGVMQILSGSESVLARYHVLEYITALEKEFRILQAQQHIREQERLKKQQ